MPPAFPVRLSLAQSRGQSRQISEQAFQLAVQAGQQPLPEFVHQGKKVAELQALAEIQELDAKRHDETLDPAERAQAQEEFEQCKPEREFLESELDKARRLKNHPRQFIDEVERNRTSVRSAIKDAIKTITHEALREHLTSSIKFGKTCKYSPKDLPQWTF